MKVIPLNDMKHLERYFKSKNIEYTISENVVQPKLPKTKTHNIFRELNKLNLHSCMTQLVTEPESKKKYIQIFNFN